MTAKLRRWIDAGRPLTPNDLTPPNVRLSERRALLDAARAGELEALAVLRSLHLRQWQSGGRWIIPEGMPPLPPEQGHRAKLAYASRSEIPRSGNGHYLRSGRLTRPRVFRAPVSPIRRDGANDCTGRNHREEEAGGRVELPHEEQPITT